MNWKISNILFFGILSICACSPTEKETLITLEQVIEKPLLEAEELLAIAADENVKVVDMRKYDTYATEHIPGAIQIWRADIESDTLPYSGVIAEKSKIEKLLSEKGIDADDFIIIYDDNASCDAARLWWVLYYYGYEKVALLNGGIKAYKKLAPTTDSITKRPETEFRFKDEINLYTRISMEDLKVLLTKQDVKLIDTRTVDEYSGREQKKGAFDYGRIPESIHIDWTQAVDYEQQKFKSIAELKNIYQKQGIDSSSHVVAYCHSGVRSAHTTFALTQLLKYKNVRNYDGSWVEWSYHKQPKVTDSLLVN